MAQSEGASMVARLLVPITINNGKAPYFSAGMRVIGEAAISP